MMSSYPQRKSPRLQGYDYSQEGAYFITICTHNRDHLFGMVANDKMQLNVYGEIVLDEWQKTASQRPNLDLDSFVVMPNHVHGIVVIMGNSDIENRTQHAASLPQTLSNNAIAKPIRSGSLSAIMRGFKSAVTKRINEERCTPSAPVWQERYHDHIIRNEIQLNKLREYILYNPATWQADKLFTDE